jgi:hypothetical protein
MGRFETRVIWKEKRGEFDYAVSIGSFGVADHEDDHDSLGVAS